MDDLAKILPKIRNADLSDYPDISLYQKPMEAGLWALWILEEKFDLYDQHFTDEEISTVLLKRGIPFDPKEITKGFTRAGKNVHKITNVIGKPAYMITRWGKEHLGELKGPGEIQVIFVDGKAPRSDYRQFSELAKHTKGEVKIVDKFYSRDSLNAIEEFGHARKVRYLSAKLAANEDLAKFKRELQRFKKEYPNKEIRVYPKEHELHDRYAITNDFLILLGRGLQDIGGKESFVIAMKDIVVKDIKATLDTKFEERWKKSSNLK